MEGRLQSYACGLPESKPWILQDCFLLYQPLSLLLVYRVSLLNVADCESNYKQII